MSLLRGCETGTTAGANVGIKAGSCLTDKRIASFDDRDNDDPSDDVTLRQCISGYVANKDQVFVNDLPAPFDTCCKCKPGQPCELCAIPTNCTDDEEAMFVAQDACFGTEPGDEPEPKPKPNECECPAEKECWAEGVWLWYGLGALLVALILGFIIGKML